MAAATGAPCPSCGSTETAPTLGNAVGNTMDCLRCGRDFTPTKLVGKTIVRRNREADPTYAPYCMRCSTKDRMRELEPFLWECSAGCGAVHDDRTLAERALSARLAVADRDRATLNAIVLLQRYPHGSTLAEIWERAHKMATAALCNCGAKQPTSDPSREWHHLETCAAQIAAFADLASDEDQAIIDYRAMVARLPKDHFIYPARGS